LLKMLWKLHTIICSLRLYTTMLFPQRSGQAFRN